MIGQTISHYKILEKLGEGGMGVVYKAQDTRLNRTVALKFLSSRLTVTDQDRTRFMHEARTASSLDHPHICAIYEIGESQDGQLFIVMPAYQGTPLSAEIEKGPLNIDRAIGIAVQITDGLQAAHEKGIIHRDIKSSNIFITKKEQVKVMDFGLARSAGMTLVTKTGLTIGTVPYMSPEQARGEKTDRRTDIWSLGVILYEMVSGQLPFRSDYSEALVYSILNEDPEPLTSLRSHVPMELERIVVKCLQKDPSSRYQHTEDLAVDLILLQKATDTSGSSVRRPSLPTHPAVFSKMEEEKNFHAADRISAVSKTEPSKKLGFLIWILSAAAVVVLALMAYAYFSRSRDALQLSSNRIAVMVFENMTGDPALDPIGRMASDWITQGLTQTGLVEIVPSASLFAVTQDMESSGLKHTGSAGVRFIAEATAAGFVISGTYYKVGSQLQLQAQITDVLSDKLLYATGHLAGSLDNPTGTIEQLRQQIMGALAVHFDDRLSSMSKMTGSHPTYEAYRHYIDGVEQYSKRDFPNAILAFKRAIGTDSEYMGAYMYLAVSYLYEGHIALADTVLASLKGNRELFTPLERANMDWLDGLLQGDRAKALQAARIAASHAPNSEATSMLISESLASNRPHEALSAISSVNRDVGYFRMDRISYYERFSGIYHILEEYEKELDVAREARKLFPEDFGFLNVEIRALIGLGKIEEVDKLLDESLTLPAQHDATPGGTMRLAGIELRAHGYPESALNAFERAISWYHERPGEYMDMYAMTLYHARRWEQSKTVFEKLAPDYHDELFIHGFLGVIAARQGNRTEALRISEWLEELERPYLFGQNTVWRARIVAQLGEPVQSVALLREAFRQGASYGIWLHNDFDLEPLRDYKPFRELVEPRG